MAAITLLPRLRERFTRLPDNCLAKSRLTGRPSLLGCQPVFRGVKVPGLQRDIWVKMASTREEWEQAFQLVTENYQSRGYEAPSNKLRFTPYHALPETRVLVAVSDAHVVATLTLVADNAVLGLPLENLYCPEVYALRKQGRRLVETTSLADRHLGFREFLQVFISMMQVGWQYLATQNIETNVITVNPRHSDYYSRVLGYATLGPRRSYAQVQGHPAEAFYLDPALMLARAPGVHQRIFGRRLPREALVAPSLSADLARQFAAQSSQTSVQLVDDILRSQGAGVRNH